MGLDYSGRLWILSASDTQNDRLLTHSGNFAHNTTIDAYCELKSHGAIEEISKCGVKTYKDII